MEIHLDVSDEETVQNADNSDMAHPQNDVNLLKDVVMETKSTTSHGDNVSQSISPMESSVPSSLESKIRPRNL